jgi:Zn-dependent M28 family amino/carboxypeptidase
MKKLVEELCSEACAGRATGTREGRAARAIVQRAMQEAGVETFEQPVPASDGANLIGRIHGSGPAILIGAHYDHLGRDGKDVYWGADDNAAAVAILVEVAEKLAEIRCERDVWMVAFDGEEPPNFLTEGMGSQEFVDHPPLPLGDIDLMICMDLCGHALGMKPVAKDLFVLGAETSDGTSALVDGISVDGLVARRAGINLLPPLSDYHAFREKRVPFLFLTGGRWRHYHTPEDTPEKLDYDKMTATARWIEQLARAPVKRKREFTDGRDDAATLRTMKALVKQMEPLWPPAKMVLARLDKIEEGNFTPDHFTEVRMALAMVEGALA